MNYAIQVLKNEIRHGFRDRRRFGGPNHIALIRSCIAAVRVLEAQE